MEIYDMLKSATNTYVDNQWKSDMKEETSLKFLNTDAVHDGITSTTTRANSLKVNNQRAEVKAKPLTGT